MKYQKALDLIEGRKSSLPVRGAWIEIQKSSAAGAMTLGRSPCGERGLKCTASARRRTPRMSLPVRGAWIEIRRYIALTHGRPSLPVRGAWIEILK